MREGVEIQDGFQIRRAAVESGIPCLTSLDTARALVEALTDATGYSVLPFAEYRGESSASVASVGDDVPWLDRIEKADIVRVVAQRTSHESVLVGEIFDATLEEIYAALKRGESVSLRNFGFFYVRPESARWVFRFNPSQRLRAVFGWSSTYRGTV